MGIVEILLRAAEVFEAREIPFMVIGGMAVSSWVEPRLTQDVDLAVVAPRKDFPRLKAALIEIGARVTALEMRLLLDRRFVRLMD